MTLLESLKKPSKHPLKGIQKQSEIPSPNLESFEETYKTSYSHGLEAIYALENVDIKSVRRIETAPQPVLKKVETKQECLLKAIQEEFDFGEAYRAWIPSFVKKEPIQVLELTKPAEKCLIDHGKLLVGDLIGVNLKSFVSLRGMGQGHIEEIIQKLDLYLDQHYSEKNYKIDFISLLKCLVASQERKKVFALLEVYDLSAFFKLSPGDNVEVRKLSLEKRQEWNREIIEKITQTEQKKSVRSDMQRIFDAFFKTWILQRGGFASKEELEERMLRISTDSKNCANVLNFLKTHYFQEKDFFSFFLHQIDHDIYCCDEFNGCNYERIIDKALSYFYKPTIYYSIQELVGFLEREFSRCWMGFPDGYIEKVLRLSPIFYTSKGLSGKLEVHLGKKI